MPTPRAHHMPQHTNLAGPSCTNLKPRIAGRLPRLSICFASFPFSPLPLSTVAMFCLEDHRMEDYTSITVPMDRRWKPHVELAPNCPRCDSTNTKFCYYNNYSLAQPRYFCKGCRRYWTKGGSLRNVPVGGGCRKNRRGKSVRLSTDSAATTTSTSRGSTPLRINPALDSGLRPDQALDDMFDNFFNWEPSKGPPIDMAVMYARYLNQVPEEAAEVEDAFGQSRATETAEIKQGVLRSDNLEFGGNNLEPMLVQTVNSEVLNEDGDTFSLNWPRCQNLPWTPEQNQGVSTSAPEVGTGRHHYQDVMFGDLIVMDHSGFEAF
ncbi:hypothetical protein HPP92_018738 [Vanilla planifolia]|uniref:Dof zinc finger protein n=1 Tax=Vanilla planifolia TaxID=51239 RepID=A0A835UIP4_VANPL|nr:hypothetical protein HPP92_027074 [Vanilla planifolia]KAG0464574.1 hypothetical protein HPP92_018738 [Vanilla planifolia]